MANIKITIEDKGVTAAFNRLLEISQDLNPVLDAIGRQVKAMCSVAFRESRDPDGNPCEIARRAAIDTRRNSRRASLSAFSEASRLDPH